ncbi:hypothetical protein [Streptomyces sp. NPDC004685]
MEEERKSHPNAYKPWTAHDEAELAVRCAQGATLAHLARELGRNEGAILGRLLRIGA